MISPEYNIEIMILPNSTHDSPTPREYAEYLKTDEYLHYLQK